MIMGRCTFLFAEVWRLHDKPARVRKSCSNCHPLPIYNAHPHRSLPFPRVIRFHLVSSSIAPLPSSLASILIKIPRKHTLARVDRSTVLFLLAGSCASIHLRMIRTGDVFLPPNNNLINRTFILFILISVWASAARGSLWRTSTVWERIGRGRVN